MLIGLIILAGCILAGGLGYVFVVSVTPPGGKFFGWSPEDDE
jgi:hypothetical protein